MFSIYNLYKKGKADFFLKVFSFSFIHFDFVKLSYFKGKKIELEFIACGG